LEAVIQPGDRICLEGDNQKQADFLAGCLADASPKTLHDLHVVQSGIVLPEHIDLFEKGIAKKLDYSYSGPQSYALPRTLKSGKIELGAIHTYIELFGRYFVDLTPHVALTVARSADREGNLDPLSAELYENPPKMENGILTVNDAPGIGVTLSAAALKKYGRKIL
jgi:malonate decarboxylase alpha subunit